MLESLEFRNYRCFSEHVLPLRPETIIVGQNNAGKSTVIEGFRLVSIITERYSNLNVRKVPDWLDIPLTQRGVKVDLSGLNLSWENLFHHYQDPPALIIATFENGQEITIYLGPNRSLHAVIIDSDGRAVKTKGEARNIDLSRVSVLPQVTPLAREEKILVPGYVRSNMSSYLAPLHFRNQLNLLYRQYFDDFKDLVERTWPGLQIIELQGRGKLPGEPLGLLVRDGGFVGEVALMGHGLQMWLQTMWFLTRTQGHDTVVLDEPDVYMHPDLQRRLLRFLRERDTNIVIATHSTEILSEADPNDVLIIDKLRNRSAFSTALPAVQQVLEDIGSSQNLSLTRLWNARRLLLVEGKDVKLLKRFQDIVYPGSDSPIDGLPNMPIGGWSGWPYAVGSAMLLTNSVGEDITTYCILDSDFHTGEEKRKRMEEAERRNVQLHIWSRKEIENYLVVPEAILRVIHRRIEGIVDPPTTDDIEAKIDQITESLKTSVIDNYAQELYNQDRSRGIAHANKKARQVVEKSWQDREGRVSVVRGKDILSKLSEWSQEEYKVSFGVLTIANELRRNELDQEVIDVISAIEHLNPFI